MKKAVLWINYALVLVMGFLVITFTYINKEVNEEQRTMMLKKQEQYNVEILTDEHYDDEWKVLDEKQKEKTDSIYTKMKWIMTLIWINLITTFVYFFIHLRETNMKLITRIVIILTITILVGIVDNTIAAIALMIITLLLKKKYKQSLNVLLFGLLIFSPFIGIHFSSI